MDHGMWWYLCNSETMAQGYRLRLSFARTYTHVFEVVLCCMSQGVAWWQDPKNAKHHEASGSHRVVSWDFRCGRSSVWPKDIYIYTYIYIWNTRCKHVRPFDTFSLVSITSNYIYSKTPLCLWMKWRTPSSNDWNENRLEPYIKTQSMSSPLQKSSLSLWTALL